MFYFLVSIEVFLKSQIFIHAKKKKHGDILNVLIDIISLALYVLFYFGTNCVEWQKTSLILELKGADIKALSQHGVYDTIQLSGQTT